MRQTWTFPLGINSGPICTKLSVQRVSVHLSHLAHFLSINKHRWLSEFQTASAGGGVILTGEWSWKGRCGAICPLHPMFKRRFSFSASANDTLPPCLQLHSLSADLKPLFRTSHPTSAGWTSRQCLLILFPSIAKLYRPYDGTPQGPKYDIFCPTPLLHLSCSQCKSWDHCLYLSFKPILTNRTVLEQTMLPKGVNGIVGGAWTGLS